MPGLPLFLFSRLHPASFPRPARSASPWIAIILLAGIGGAAPGAAIPWHDDLPQAKAASLISRRPVLVIFTAQWSEASLNLEKTCLGSDDAVALVTACFEPVRIDVDSDPETTRRMGVSYLPTACVVDASDRLLARFDCPESSSGFVAAAGRAAQDSAAALAEVTGHQPARYSPHDSATAATGHDDRPQPPSTPSAQVDADSLPTTPPGWAAERTATPVQTASPPPPGNKVESASTRTIEPPTNHRATQPWLDASAAAATASSASTATAAVPPPAGGTEAPAGATPPERPTATTSLLSAFQKPFSILSRSAPSGSPTKERTPPHGSPAQRTGVATTDVQGAHGSVAEPPLGSMPVGLEGYCPVTLAEKGKWVEGRAQWGVRHRGRTYLFAGPEQQQAFLADPDRYAPALSGDDPVVALDSGRAVAGQRRYGVTYQSRIYLFSSAESRTAFAANPQKYTGRVLLAEKPDAAGDPIVR